MEEDERKEAAIARSAALQPEFISKSLKQEQIDKLKELHKKRLQIKAKTKIHKISQGSTLSLYIFIFSLVQRDSSYLMDISPGNISGTGKGHKKNIISDFVQSQDSNVILEESGKFASKGNAKEFPSLQLDKSNASLGTKKPQKLHWGYFSDLLDSLSIYYTHMVLNT
ncbi:hypothetical protein Scep_022642 [Stephania cephalantha]|uniref:Uncharacterized protein n=1 Tax=Stephania cephalantha TaxID=152367 RepID=A0AAP0FB19_9MAGN